MTEKQFVDRFGDVAERYVARPHYPEALFQWLAEQSPSQGVVWDCGCGSGQAAHDLARYFDQVIATDASAAQIALAKPNPKVVFRQAAAEYSGLPSNSVDLIFVGTAVHWFDLPAFYEEVRRVAKPNAIIALVMYGKPTIADSTLDKPLQEFSDLVEPYGAPELAHYRNNYHTLPFPFDNELQMPPMEMLAFMPLEQLSDYLHSRSPVKNYIQSEGHDPVTALEEILSELHSIPDEPIPVRWPLYGRVARLPAAKLATNGQD